MKVERKVLVATLASLITAVGVPSALAATATPAVPHANGNDVILGDGSVFELGDDGVYHWIPDVATANAMHLSWNDLIVVDSTDDLDADIGDPLPSVEG